jgi:hypothetical protein
MTRRPPQGELAESPAKQLAGFIARFDPAIATRVRSARAIVRKRFFPTAVELVYDNYNALAIAFGPTERASDAIVSLAVYARGVNLYFIYGATLPDPHRLLQGAGTRGRFVRLDDLALFDRPEIKQLLRDAIRLGEPPLPKTGRGYTVIKSVSKKQRSRRPPQKKRKSFRI